MWGLKPAEASAPLVGACESESDGAVSEESAWSGGGCVVADGSFGCGWTVGLAGCRDG